MKTALFFIAVFLALFMVSLLTFSPELILNPYYNIRYRWSHLPTYAVSSLDSQIFQKFGSHDTGGEFNYSGEINLLYESRHDQSTNTYYYRFANTGRNLFCASSEAFALLTGNSKIKLRPGETKYFILKSEKGSVLNENDLRFFESCGWFSYSGGKIELAVPKK